MAPTSALAGGLVSNHLPTERVAATTDPVVSPAASDGKRSGPGDKPDFYDARTDPAARPAMAKKAATLDAQPGVRQLRRSLGAEGLVDIDPVTSTPRTIARTNGFLTKSSSASPQSIALSYVKDHASVFRLSAAAIDGLKLRQDYADVAGTHHLSFTQSVGGVPVFGNGLKAHVAKDGRLIGIDGSPVASLPGSLAAPKISASQARSAAIGDVFGTATSAAAKTAGGPTKATTFAGGDKAQLVVFAAIGGPVTAWQTITSPSKSQMYLHVVDAATKRVLYRRNLVQNDNALVVDNYPGAPVGGTPHTVTLKTSWLPNNSPQLAGNVAHVYTDVNDSNRAEGSEEVRPSKRGSFVYPMTTFDLGGNCSAAFPCTWNPDVANSWQANRSQGAVQQFYFIGKYHDHLAANPIGFTRSAGNFEAVDGDAVQGENVDGADTANGLPDPNHIDNANFATPPDGTPPRMQMYLWHQPGADDDPFNPSNGADESDIVYHEYTHGLSNRLVVDANGVSTLGNLQAGSMGEAWSDWYAFDFLVNDGLVNDTKADGDIRVGEYVGAGHDLIRSQPLDCPVGSKSAKCKGGAGTPAGSGGYTYGDFGLIGGGPEVHADGEIWGETLWDLRAKIGPTLAESLVTRAMELSPANPSYLDMRNSILQADMVVNKGAAHKAVWQVFAHRGMGYFAGSVDGDDTQPAEDFSMPPKPGTPTATLSGTVTESPSGDPIAGATVAFGGHNSGFAGDLAAVTAADGTYSISGIFPGTYPKVFASGPGFDRLTRSVSVNSSGSTADWQLRRDWAASSGGGEITDFTGPDFSDFGCGPSAMIDQSQGSGWGSDVVGGTNGQNIEPRLVVVKLPNAVDITELAINPTATCGDGGSASAGDFKVETSPDGTTWTQAASGHFGLSARGQMNTVPLAAGSGTGVQYVRYTITSSQVVDTGGTCPGAFSGCDFVDSVELAVYGSAS
ncbi:MAG TPA: M36 family metallopeptidase [Actinopolymorphaceae bacterium]|nr:M36 family metallopeptidase [Actinopolymorphaceae bacterium]